MQYAQKQTNVQFLQIASGNNIITSCKTASNRIDLLAMIVYCQAVKTRSRGLCGLVRYAAVAWTRENGIKK